MKKLLSLFAVMFALVVNAQTVERTFYIDYGQNPNASNGKITNVDANGNSWNNLYGKGTGQPDKIYPQTITLKDSKGNNTEFKLQLSSRFSTNGNTNGSLMAPSATLLKDLAVESATMDYIFLEENQDYAILRFKGLDLNKGYRFYSFGSRTSSEERSAIFEFRGLNTWSGVHVMGGTGIGANNYNGNNNNIQESDIVFPDENGNIEMTIIKQNKGGMVYINAMKVVEYSGVKRPEYTYTLQKKMFFDFGEKGKASSRGEITTGADTNGNYWNNMSPASSSTSAVTAGTSIDIVASDNTATGYKLTNKQQVNANGVNNGGWMSPKAEDLGELAVVGATQDYMYSEGNALGKMQFTGLDKTKKYRFHIFGTRKDDSSYRSTVLTLTGKTVWQTVQVTSGPGLGGDGINQNVRNIAVSDYIAPDASGNIEFTYQQNTAPSSSFGHISAMKMEEFDPGENPEPEPLTFKSLKLSGNAEDVNFIPVINANLTYEAYAKLTKGTFTITGVDENDKTYTLSADGTNKFAYTGSTLFTASKDMVARITINTNKQTIEILPVEMYVKGNMGAGSPKIAYKGNGVWESKVTLRETTSQQWVDKTMYFAFNNSDTYAIKRLSGSKDRFVIGETCKRQSVENILQNAGTYTITVDMINKRYNIDAPIDENRISVFGSSVANGQGATDYKGYRYLYGELLKDRGRTGRSENKFYTSNVSIGGNTTINLLDRYDDVIRDFGRYVIFGLSLGNEGIHGASNPQQIFNQWRDNMLKLIEMVRADGRIPVVMNNYTRGDYNSTDYDYVKKLNLLIHEWDVPSFNCLGSIDKGNGQWADGYVSDTYHQNTEGHYEFFLSMVPSLFDAIKAEKPQPVRNMEKSMTIGKGKMLTFTPEEKAHPFTITVRVKGTPGELFSFKEAAGDKRTASVYIDVDGTVVYKAANGTEYKNTKKITDDDWHFITLTHYYAQKRTILYVDIRAKEVTGGERIEQISDVKVGNSAEEREISELFFWRSGMTNTELNTLSKGTMLKSSLEIYVPTAEGELDNLAQSLNKVTLENDPTGIKAVNSNADASSLYDLQGRKLNKAEKGIYIKGGNKYIAK